MAKTIVGAASIVIVLLMTTIPYTSPARAQTPTPETDPTAVFRQFVDAVNAGDVDGALALFTDDATWVRGGPSGGRCPPGACIGLAAVRAEIEKDVADGHRIDIVDIQVSGNTLTARVELRTNGTRAAGIERVIQVLTLEFREDKISALQARPDLTDPETAAHASAGRRLPTTGGGPPPSREALQRTVLLGTVLLLTGGLLTILGFGMKTVARRR